MCLAFCPWWAKRPITISSPVGSAGGTCGAHPSADARPLPPREAAAGRRARLMSLSEAMNIRSEEWDENQAEGRRRRVVSGERLGATLYELSRGGGIAYHFHHGTEELLVVLRGRVTLRTPQGTREVSSGELVHFPVGPEGAHAITKEDDEPVRYLMVSTLASPNVTEYPDTRQIAVTAATKNQFGEDLLDVLTLEPRKK
jgi:uncharacterized cupin superfamily protein